MIGVSSWRYDCHVKVHDWLFKKKKVKAAFICDNYILVKDFLKTILVQRIAHLYVTCLSCLSGSVKGKCYSTEMCLCKEFHHVVAVVILPHHRSGAVISLIWRKYGWLLKGVVLISCVFLLPIFHWFWACLLGGGIHGVFFFVLKQF